MIITPKFYYLPNLIGQSVQEIEPWDVEVNRPPFDTKAEFRSWSKNPATDHAFISAAEGHISTLRVSETNPAVRMSGLVLDYDAIPPASPELAVMNNAPAGLRPAWVSRTFSGNVRVLYKFESSVSVFSPALARAFLRILCRELKLKKLLPGFEEEALYETEKYYEIGNQWTAVGDGSHIIPYSLLMKWLTDASTKHKWNTEGPSIPIEILRAEAEKRFGSEAWPGGWEAFEVGGRGRRFWDQSATDITGVIVRESGCQYFTDGGGFKSWLGIFGTDFVRKWNDDRIGTAIADIWFDGKLYWKEQPDGSWAFWSADNTRLHLKVEKGLSSSPPVRGAPSEVDVAMHGIHNVKRVVAAMPFIYRENGKITYNDADYLNISNVKPTTPLSTSVGWGEGFPWIAQFLYTLFDPNDQLDHFIGWLKHFYVGAITQAPSRGLALFIAGPVGVGKTFLNKCVIGGLMGGSQDAGSFLLNGDKFNDGLFKNAVWTIDDEVTPADTKQRSIFSQMVKRIVANDSFTYRAMYRSGDDMEWIGRIIVTLNDDPESLQILPETDINILDKIMLLKVKVPDVPSWPTLKELEAELPFFGAFLRDWDMPEHLIPPPNKQRFGIMPFSHEDLLEVANSSSATSAFEDLLQQWRSEWFSDMNSATEWTGNSTALLQALLAVESLRPIVMKSFGTAKSVGIHLNKLLKRMPPCVWVSAPVARKYVIKKHG